MRTALAVAAFAGGVGLVAVVCFSAVSTVVVPRGVPVFLTRVIFLWSRRLFELRARAASSYAGRDQAMAHFAPVTLMTLPVVWITLVLLGYTAVFWSLGVRPLRQAFFTSGSSLLTLGFASVTDLPTGIVSFSAAAVGLILLALLITYLPSMYAAFSRREETVTLLAIQAGTPASAMEMIERFNTLGDLDGLNDVWRSWTRWFVDLEETHTSLAAVAFFRSPSPDRSWVTSAGAVLDAAALVSSTVEVPRSPPAELCIRSGYLSLRAIADFHGVDHEPDPDPGDPISISRDEWEQACGRMAAAGVPLRADRDRAWRDFAGWRVNYDLVLVTLAGLTMAPYAPWSSDRSPARPHRPPVRRRRAGS